MDSKYSLFGNFISGSVPYFLLPNILLLLTEAHNIIGTASVHLNLFSIDFTLNFMFLQAISDGSDGQ